MKFSMNGKTFDLVPGEDVSIDVPEYAEVGDHILDPNNGDMLKIYEIFPTPFGYNVALTKIVKKNVNHNVPELAHLTALEINQECFVNLFKSTYGIKPRIGMSVTLEEWNDVDALQKLIEELATVENPED